MFKTFFEENICILSVVLDLQVYTDWNKNITKITV